MNATQEKPKSKKWIWIVVILAALLVCCGIAAVAGGYFYLQSAGKTIDEALSGELLEPQVDVPLPQTQEPPPGVAPDMPSTATPQDEPAPVPLAEDQMVVVATSGVWAVNENTGEAIAVSPAPLDAPWHPEDGMSPDGKAFAFLTGYGGASLSPYLIVLDLAQQSQELELSLTGPLSTPDMEMMPGDPAFEATRAMEFTGGFAWSSDGRMLAFAGAMDGATADVYLYDRKDGSVTRLSDEIGHAAQLHWSPDGRYLEYVSVDSFGTGAGMGMAGLWTIDMQTREPMLLERLESGGESFLGWVDDSHFLMHSWGPACSGYNMRVVDAADGAQEAVVGGCFSAAAFNPGERAGLLALEDYNVEYCMCGQSLEEAGLYAFYLDQEPIPMSKVEAYAIDFLPEGDVFAFQPVGEEYKVYNSVDSSITILPEVIALKPFPASPDGYWAWYSEVFSAISNSLWVTLNNENPVLVSSSCSSEPAWSDDGQTLYFIENNSLYKASAPDFTPQAVPGVTGELLNVVN